MNRQRAGTSPIESQGAGLPHPHTVVLRTGIILGIGVVGSLDEIIFHQLLQWHNFYVHTTTSWRIVSDGIFHIFTVVMLVWASVRLWRQRRLVAEVAHSRALWAGVMLGMGGFQLYDGIVNHKILRLHPIREGVERIIVYDLIWNAGAAALLVAGWHFLRRARGASASLDPPDGYARLGRDS